MASRKVALRGEPIVDEQETASEAITPGHLIEIDTGQWRKHATAAGNASPVFALERDELGSNFDTAYAASDNVKAGRFRVGDKVNALIASGQNLSKGAFVESAGDGTVRALAADAATDQSQRRAIVGQSAVDSGAVTELTRHPIWIV